MNDVIVIGGGAAGMLSAITAARAGASVLLIERNEKLGKKVYITGKGRCNVTNAAERERFFANIIRNPRFLYAAYAKLDNMALMDLLEDLGVPLKTERGERVFPVSDKSSDIIRALEAEIRRLNVEILFGTRVASLLTEGERVTGVKTESGRKIEGKSVIIATGGLSYPSTGSTGDGYRFAEATGHTLMPCRPSLVPVETMETWPASLSGLTLKNIRLTAKANGKEIYSDQGEMLFTHFGISGPLVLSLSAVLPDNAKGTALEIDMKPALSLETLDERLQRDVREQPRAGIITILNALLPRSLAQVVLDMSGMPADLKASNWKAADRRAMAALVKAIPLTVSRPRGYNEAVITKGGISVKDINPSTMASKKIQGLYFAGEAIDIDALTGGFNLQIAFSTGALAGEKAALTSLAAQP